MAKVVKTDKGFGVQVVDAHGHPRIVASKDGTADMTLDQLVEAERLLECGAVLGGAALAEERGHGAARQRAQPGEQEEG